MIYILDSDPAKCAKALDDKSLDKMIKDIAQVLCNVHYRPFPLNACFMGRKPDREDIPLAFKSDFKAYKNIRLWTFWGEECKANYLYLVELAKELIKEAELYRKLKNYAKEFNITGWARDNVPDLPIKCRNYNNGMTEFALVMPKKFQSLVHYNPDNWNTSDHIDNVIYAYRNYYQAKLKQDGKWTRRDKPQWLEGGL